MRVSVGVAAYNEEKNIRQFLLSLLSQKMARADLTEVVVVASGCTDATHAQVETVIAGDRRVRLLVQDARMGKTAALNAYARERDPSADMIVLSSADLLLQPGCLQVFLETFDRYPNAGMVGARPVPTNPRGSLMGDVVYFLWQLHHEISLEAPKLGEIVALRAALFQPLPEESPVDEASLEAQVVAAGYRLHYAPQALVANRGPDNIREFIDQRRRIAAGHFWLRDTSGYSVSTLDVPRIVRHALKHVTLSDLRTDAHYATAAALEAIARGLGWIDRKRKYSHAVWKVAPSTREVTKVPEPNVKKAGYG